MSAGLTRIVLVTGLSGAGKSTALKQFEDLGWEVADNIPISLLTPMVREISPEGWRNIAVGVDTRTRGFSEQKVLNLRDELREDPSSEVTLLYLGCDAATLQRRFTETRRRHPMASDRPVMDGILEEKRLLEMISKESDEQIDTTLLSLPELRQQLINRFSLEDQPALSITVTSFSFKKGLPREADLVFDMRFLRNPYYDPDLREKTGQQKEVADYIAEDESFAPFLDQLKNMLDTLLPRYRAEGKSYLTIAIGCTGGRHRSVCVAENIHDHMERNGYLTHLVHRDLP
ncbi:RNase adapter RapZ [Sneathiella sp. P13V-1]|uniref:RNase adapter RapZ n=1 Tax=Sneathiella sp. P13V-1 TaxID=2697366 RepID=UPI00187BA991|nr:RNase adapter RapZ [Sneathiella sp. P13V-1]MBE7636017.1 RNase adapter RapZ [Sneathiella sp. P13V-1]